MANQKSKLYSFGVALIVALGGFLMGFDASVISGVVGFIEPEFALTKLQLGWAVSCLTLTATLAMAISGPLSDKIGRKKVLVYASILFFISALFSALAPNFISLIIARMLGGFGVGAALITAPMYIAEIAPPKNEGPDGVFQPVKYCSWYFSSIFHQLSDLTIGEIRCFLGTKPNV